MIFMSKTCNTKTRALFRVWVMSYFAAKVHTLKKQVKLLAPTGSDSQPVWNM
jgi:hypothetical protein